MMLYARWISRTPLPIIPGSVPTLLSLPEIGHLVLQMMLPRTFMWAVGMKIATTRKASAPLVTGDGRFQTDILSRSLQKSIDTVGCLRWYQRLPFLEMALIPARC